MSKNRIQKDLRSVLQNLMTEHDLNPSSWSLRAGKSRNFLAGYFSGRINDMTIGTLNDFAKAIHLNAADILNLTHNHDDIIQESGLARVRRILQISIEKLSQLSNIDAAQLRSYECPGVTIPTDIAAHLAKILKCPVEEFDIPQTITLSKVMDTLTPSQREQVNVYAHSLLVDQQDNNDNNRDINASNVHNVEKISG